MSAIAQVLMLEHYKLATPATFSFSLSSTFATASSPNFYAVTYAATVGLFVAVGDGGTLGGSSSSIYYSANGSTWTQASCTGSGSINWVDVTYGNGYFLAVSNSNVYAYSTNGTSWTSGTISGAFKFSSVSYAPTGGAFCITDSVYDPTTGILANSGALSCNLWSTLGGGGAPTTWSQATVSGIGTQSVLVGGMNDGTVHNIAMGYSNNSIIGSFVLEISGGATSATPSGGTGAYPMPGWTGTGVAIHDILYDNLAGVYYGFNGNSMGYTTPSGGGLNGAWGRLTTNLSGVTITGTGGTFSCTAAGLTLVVGQTVVISGTLGGTGSIVGYIGLTTAYYITATNGSTTFTLSASYGGTAISTTAGTPTGLTYAYYGPPNTNTSTGLPASTNHFKFANGYYFALGQNSLGNQPQIAYSTNPMSNTGWTASTVAFNSSTFQSASSIASNGSIYVAVGHYGYVAHT